MSRHTRDDEHAVLAVTLHVLSATLSSLRGLATGGVARTEAGTYLPRALEVILVRDPVRKQVVPIAGDSVPARLLCISGL